MNLVVKTAVALKTASLVALDEAPGFPERPPSPGTGLLGGFLEGV